MDRRSAITDRKASENFERQGSEKLSMSWVRRPSTQLISTAVTVALRGAMLRRAYTISPTHSPGLTAFSSFPFCVTLSNPAAST